MGDTSLSADILDGVVEAMDAVGWTLSVKYFEEGALDINNPGAGRPKTEVTFDLEGFVYDIEDKSIDGTNIKAGDRKGVLSIKDLTEAQRKKIAFGSYLVDGAVQYHIKSAKFTAVAGVPVVVEVLLRNK